jgi:hypothetical protein
MNISKYYNNNSPLIEQLRVMVIAFIVVLLFFILHSVPVIITLQPSHPPLGITKKKILWYTLMHNSNKNCNNFGIDTLNSFLV